MYAAPGCRPMRQKAADLQRGQRLDSSGTVLRAISPPLPLRKSSRPPLAVFQSFCPLFSFRTQQFSKIILALALVAGASAFAPMARPIARAVSADATVQQTLETATGPNIYWGSAGVLVGKEENDIKGTTDFKLFAAAARASGVDLNSGEYTVLAPTDLAMENAGKTTLTPEEVKLHCIPGKIDMTGLCKDQVTVGGDKLTYRRFARQNYLDDAIIGQTPQGPATGETHPSIMCDNGYVHSIAFVLYQGYSTLTGEQGISTIG